MLRLQIERERSGANRVRRAHSQSSTPQELKPGRQRMSLCQSFQDASSTCRLHSAVSLGIHPGHRPLTPSGWRDSAGGADPTPGYHLQTWIAGAVSGTENTTNTQHGLTALALGFPSPEAVSDPFFWRSLPLAAGQGPGPARCSADGAVASAAAAAPHEPGARTRSPALRKQDPDPSRGPWQCVL